MFRQYIIRERFTDLILGTLNSMKEVQKYFDSNPKTSNIILGVSMPGGTVHAGYEGSNLHGHHIEYDATELHNIFISKHNHQPARDLRQC